jgi:hypothetical protein
MSKNLSAGGDNHRYLTLKGNELECICKDCTLGKKKGNPAKTLN